MKSIRVGLVLIAMLMSGISTTLTQGMEPGPEFEPSERCPHPAALGPGGRLMYCDRDELAYDELFNMTIHFVADKTSYAGCAVAVLVGAQGSVEYEASDAGLIRTTLLPGQYMLYYYLCDDMGNILIGRQASGFVVVNTASIAVFHYNYLPDLSPVVEDGQIILDVTEILRGLGVEPGAVPIATPYFM